MSEAANAERGEISINLEGMPHVLTPSFQAQVVIEEQTGRSVEQLAQAAGNSSLTLKQAAIVVTECVKAHGRATNDATLTGYNAERVGQCIVETGKLIVVKRLELLLFLAATGGYSASGEVKALPMTTAPVGPAAIAA